MISDDDFDGFSGQFEGSRAALLVPQFSVKASDTLRSNSGVAAGA
ncbi:hypothetical protein ABZY45_26070 [Streptomyces sp. NPDC006516]